MADRQQRLVLAIIEFLNQSINDGTVKADDKEGLEVAGNFIRICDVIQSLMSFVMIVQCIGEAFGVDPTDEQQVERLSVKPATLQTVFDVFLKTREKVGSAPGSSASPPTSATKTPSAEDKAKAEKCKQSGNSLMTSKKYDQAIESYTQAIALDPTNPVYFSNRAAAHASKNDHLSAVGDSEKAIEVDPSFVKAYSRLGSV
jgi:small glutamine-rich tetratricopeptide repeat-containing protein alpha